MHRILSLLVVSMFILEEVLHQKLGKSGRLSTMPASYDVLKNNFDKFDILRILELLSLGLLLSTAAGNPGSGHGQLTMILVGLQTARLFGRRVLSRWSVLGVLQGIEMILLLAFIFVPMKAASGVIHLSPVSLLALMGGVIYGILISISAAFSISYGIRLFATESSNLYETFPPLASSESWSYKFSKFSLFSGTAGLAGLFLLWGVSQLSVLFAISLSLQFAGVLISRKQTFNGHHPISHILWGISFLLLYSMTLSGITTVSLPL